MPVSNEKARVILVRLQRLQEEAAKGRRDKRNETAEEEEETDGQRSVASLQQQMANAYDDLGKIAKEDLVDVVRLSNSSTCRVSDHRQPMDKRSHTLSPPLSLPCVSRRLGLSPPAPRRPPAVRHLRVSAPHLLTAHSSISVALFLTHFDLCATLRRLRALSRRHSLLADSLQELYFAPPPSSSTGNSSTAAAKKGKRVSVKVDELVLLSEKLISNLTDMLDGTTAPTDPSPAVPPPHGKGGGRGPSNFLHR